MPVTLCLSLDPKADALLSRDPLALVIGMVLDQQIPLEKAFRGPYDLLSRLGVKKLSAKEIAAWDPEDLVQHFVEVPAIHRFPAAMARRVQDLCQVLVDEYGGKAENVWKDAADGKELVKRIKDLPGFGEHKAKIFTALLGKQLGVQPEGWREAAGTFGEEGSLRSVADITSRETMVQVRAAKAAAKKAAAS